MSTGKPISTTKLKYLMEMFKLIPSDAKRYFFRESDNCRFCRWFDRLQNFDIETSELNRIDTTVNHHIFLILFCFVNTFVLQSFDFPFPVFINWSMDFYKFFGCVRFHIINYHNRDENCFLYVWALNHQVHNNFISKWLSCGC